MLQHDQVAVCWRTIQDQRHGSIGRWSPIEDLRLLHTKVESIGWDINQRILDLLRIKVLQKLDWDEGLAEALRYLEVVAIGRHFCDQAGSEEADAIHRVQMIKFALLNRGGELAWQVVGRHKVRL